MAAWQAARGSTSPSRRDFGALDHAGLSPHGAGHSLATQRPLAWHLAVTLNAAMAGKPPPNPVDATRGY